MLDYMSPLLNEGSEESNSLYIRGEKQDVEVTGKEAEGLE